MITNQCGHSLAIQSLFRQSSDDHSSARGVLGILRIDILCIRLEVCHTVYVSKMHILHLLVQVCCRYDVLSKMH